MNPSITTLLDCADLTPKERWRLFARCHLRSFAHWQTWLGLLAAVVMAAAGQLTMRWLFPSLTAREAPLFGTSGAVLGWVIGGHISWKVRVRVVEKLLRQELPHLRQTCGYDCRATANRCPECGTPSTHAIAA